MFYLPQALLTWVVSVWAIQWRRARELLVYGLYGGFLCVIQDQLARLNGGLWEYRDTGPINAHTEISLLIGISAAPLFGMHFAQGLKRGARPPWRQIAVVIAVAMIPETIGLYTGHIVYHSWWNYGCSLAAHLLLWLSFWALHRWLTRVKV